MLTREEVRRLALEAKGRFGLTWPQLGEAVGRSPVYAAMLVHGYGQATRVKGTNQPVQTVGELKGEIRRLTDIESIVQPGG